MCITSPRAEPPSTFEEDRIKFFEHIGCKLSLSICYASSYGAPINRLPDPHTTIAKSGPDLERQLFGNLAQV